MINIFQVILDASVVIFHKVSDLTYTVVKRGHTEGIEREKTSFQKSTVIAFQLEWQVVLALEGIMYINLNIN